MATSPMSATVPRLLAPLFGRRPVLPFELPVLVFVLLILIATAVSAHLVEQPFVLASDNRVLILVQKHPVVVVVVLAPLPVDILPGLLDSPIITFCGTFLLKADAE